MLGRVGGASFAAAGATSSAVSSWPRSGRSRSSATTSASTQLLAFNLRMRAALLRAGRYDSLHHLAEFESALRARVKVRVGSEEERLTLRVTATLGAPGELAVRPRGRAGARGAHRRRCARCSPTRTSTPPRRCAPAASRSTCTRCATAPSTCCRVTPRSSSAPTCGRSSPPTSSVAAATAAAGAPLPPGDWEVRAVVTVAGFSHARSVRRNGAPLVLRSSPRPPRRPPRRAAAAPAGAPARRAGRETNVNGGWVGLGFGAGAARMSSRGRYADLEMTFVAAAALRTPLPTQPQLTFPTNLLFPIG